MKAMKKILSAIMAITFVIGTSVTAFAATKCSKGHTYDVNHYCATCNVFDSTYTGMAKNKTTWYYVKSGKIDTSYTGMAKNQWGWWYIKGGKLDTSYTGMAKNQWGWWYMKKGKLDTTYTGMAKNQWGWWYMKNGKLDTSYTGLAKNQYGWWYMKNGKLDTSYTGIADNQYGTWYVKNGKVTTSYTGTYTDKNGKKWTVTKGKISSERSIVKFGESTLSVPSTPITINCYEDCGDLYSTVNISSIAVSYDEDFNEFYVTIKGKKTYGVSNRSSSCCIDYKIYDSEDNVIESGSWCSPDVSVGESFIIAHEEWWGLCIDDYRLEIMTVSDLY